MGTFRGARCDGVGTFRGARCDGLGTFATPGVTGVATFRAARCDGVGMVARRAADAEAARKHLFAEVLAEPHVVGNSGHA